MNYHQLQKSLKPLKAKGLTKVKLNACEKILRTEYERLLAAGYTSADEDCQPSISPLCSHMAVEDSTGAISPVASSQQLSSCDEEIELDPEIEALVVESWTDNPEQAIVTAAAYVAAGLAIVVLWIALVATTLTIAGLKCWHWCRSHYSDLDIQLRHFDPSIEFPALAKTQFTSLISMRSLFAH